LKKILIERRELLRWTAFSGPALIYLDGCGGTSQAGGSTDVWYSTDGHSWTKLAGTPWVARHAASVFVFQNALWIGNGSSAAVYNDVWKMAYAT